MPENTLGTLAADVGDQPQGGDGSQTAPEATERGADGTTDKGFYVGTYKDREAAERGLREKEDAFRQAQSERDKAKAEADALKQLLTTVAATKPKESEAEPQVDWDKFYQDVDEHPRKAVDAALKWIRDLDTKVSKTTEEKLTGLKAEIQKLQERVVTVSPDYQRNRDMIEEARKHGMSLDDALVFAAKFGKPAVAQRLMPPGMIGGGGAGGGGEEDATLSAETLSMLQGLTGQLDDKDKTVLKRRTRK